MLQVKIKHISTMNYIFFFCIKYFFANYHTTNKTFYHMYINFVLCMLIFQMLLEVNNRWLMTWLDVGSLFV
jgi:hypothetical protein